MYMNTKICINWCIHIPFTFCMPGVHPIVGLCDYTVISHVHTLCMDERTCVLYFTQFTVKKTLAVIPHLNSHLKHSLFLERDRIPLVLEVRT